MSYHSDPDCITDYVDRVVRHIEREGVAPQIPQLNFWTSDGVNLTLSEYMYRAKSSRLVLVVRREQPVSYREAFREQLQELQAKVDALNAAVPLGDANEPIATIHLYKHDRPPVLLGKDHVEFVRRLIGQVRPVVDAWNGVGMTHGSFQITVNPPQKDNDW